MKSWLLLLALLLSAPRVFSYPPAPHHLIYGMVRDQYGNPIDSDTAEIIFETTAGALLKAKIQPGLEAGVNYKIAAPMDAGLTSDLYAPTALRPTTPFRIRVKIGSVIYLPIEMAGNFANLGRPGQKTLLNLTLGQDSDGDGLPDEWERALIAMMGHGTLASVRANGDDDGDGMSNLDEYLAGTYAFDKADGLTLQLVASAPGKQTLEFAVVQGRNYAIMGSSNLQTWTPALFNFPDATDGQQFGSYQAGDTRILRVEVSPSAEAGPMKFYKLIIH
jgi:hypothetical protein